MESPTLVWGTATVTISGGNNFRITPTHVGNSKGSDTDDVVRITPTYVGSRLIHQPDLFCYFYFSVFNMSVFSKNGKSFFFIDYDACLLYFIVNLGILFDMCHIKYIDFFTDGIA